MAKQTVEERFWGKVGAHGPVALDGTRCWTWTAGKQCGGYGQFNVDSAGRRSALAHRVAYELGLGPIPDGLHVLHACDNRACVNPAHLFLGDAAANMADMDAKGRRRNAEARVMRTARAVKQFTGAYQHRSGAWYSRARVDGKDAYLGRFDSEEDAHAAYVAFTRAADALMDAHRHEIDRKRPVPVTGWPPGSPLAGDEGTSE